MFAIGCVQPNHYGHTFYLPSATRKRDQHLPPQGNTARPVIHVTWNQQQPGASVGSMATNDYALRYDAIGQLRQAVLNGDSTNPGSSVWNYDAAGNRIGVQSGSGTLSTAVPTSTNSLFSLKGGGSVFVAGTLSKWANVTVNARTASFNPGNNTFQAFVPMPTGAQTISISATDVDGNTATNAYQLTISAGAGESFAYDANGNTTTLTPTTTGITPETFEWDAVDRVTAIDIGTHRTQFAYDGNGARVRITEMDNGAVTTDRFYVANEERDAAGGQVLRLFFGQGEQRIQEDTASEYYYAHDHLGSIRELTDATNVVQASYSYDSWGGRTILRGGLDTEIGFTGYWHHTSSGLEISPTRFYSVQLGAFINQDPSQENGGLNLYAYCFDNPVNARDPDGLAVEVYYEGIGAGNTFNLSRYIASFVGKHPYIHVTAPVVNVTLELEGPKAGVPYGNITINPFNPKRGGSVRTANRPVSSTDYSFEYAILSEFCQYYSDPLTLPDYDALYQNSNTFANYLITNAGGSINDIPLGAVASGQDFAGGPQIRLQVIDPQRVNGLSFGP
jgi:RHS repeat-associated protein